MVFPKIAALIAFAPLSTALAQQPVPAESADLRSLRAAVEELEYALEAAPDDAWSARHHEQAMAGTFDARGLRLESAGHVLELALDAWGRADDLVPAATAERKVDGRRIEYVRGDLVEWYVHDPRGLEQGFTITARPEGAGEFELRLAVAGDLAGVTAGTRAARFVDRDGATVFHYTGLVAFDAAGARLPARLETGDGTLSLLVDDAHATYPLVVDPWLWTEQARLSADERAEDNYLGWAVAASGDTFVIGSPGTDPGGVAYVFRYGAAGWMLEALLRRPGGVVSGQYGQAVAIDGDTILVGAQTDATSGAQYPGAVYVYVRDGVTWTEQAKLLITVVAGNGGSPDFGAAVAVSGDLALVGAPDAGPGGRVFPFERTGTTWDAMPFITASDLQQWDTYGVSVAIDGDRAVVGNTLNDPVGTIYVLERTGPDDIWREQAILTASDGQTIGGGVAIEGDTIVSVGAGSGIWAPHPFAVNAYVFRGGGMTWTEEAILTSSFGAPLSNVVAISGERVVVGSPFDDVDGNWSGSATVFERSGTTWSEVEFLTPSLGEAGAEFGWGVAISGDAVVAGAPLADPSATENTGIAYAFEESGGSWTETTVLDENDAATGDSLGRAVAIDGETAIVGADTKGDSGVDSGAAYVYERSGKTWHRQAKLLASDGAAGDRFGGAVAVSGDTALIGAAGNDGAGSAYVFERAGEEWSEQARLTAVATAPGDAFGTSVSVDGDLALVGAPGHLGAGAAHAFERTGSSWIEEATLTAGDGAPGDGLGGAVSLSLGSALAGAPGDDDDGNDAGSAYVFLRPGTSWSEQSRLAAAATAAGDEFGGAVALWGGTALIGASGADGVGAAYVFDRSGSTWSEAATFTPELGVAGDEYGASVALWIDTALVGAPGVDGGEGAVFSHHRIGGTWSARAELRDSSPAAGDAFGSSVAVSRKTSVTGAVGDSFAASNAGAALVHLESFSPGEVYCTAGISASGCQAFISASGIPSATATSGFDLSVTNLEGAKNGLFFYGTNGRQANAWGSGTSYVCVVPPRVRGGLLIASGSTAGFCDGAFTQDLNARWCPTCPKPAHNPGPGAVMQAQLWYRDPQNTSNQSSSMSDAIEFIVWP